jgi:hypothetical protein
MAEEGRDDTTGRFVAGNPQSGRAGRRRAEVLTPAERSAIAAKGYRSATVAAGKIRAILADLWARRVWQETEYAYTVPVDEELAARIEAVLVRSKLTLERAPGQDVEAS